MRMIWVRQRALPGVAEVSGTIPEPTGTDDRYHEYRVTITPHHEVC